MKILTSEHYSIIEKGNVFYEKKVSSCLGNFYGTNIYA